MSLQTKRPGDREREQCTLMLQTALKSALPLEASQWFSDQLALVAIEKSNRSVDMSFGLCTRRLGKHKPDFSQLQLRELNKHLPGWRISELGVDAIARMLIIASFHDAAQLAVQVTRLLKHADLHEQLALYSGLPLFKPSDELNDRLADGLRSNVSDIFNSIAHYNPYPAWYLDTHRFNHLVLKALFIDSALAPIVGLAQRNNEELARMLLETARERYAASRPVSDELWTLTIPYMTDAQKCEFKMVNAS